MKRTICVCLALALLAVFWVPGVSADTLSCAECEAAGLTCTKLESIDEYERINETQHVQYFECNNGHKQLRVDEYGNYIDASKHAVASGETLCNSNAVCAKCGAQFESHDFGAGVVTAPTCSKEGCTTYTCQICKTVVITDKTAQLSHWYAEWKPAGNGQNSAPCKREGCTHTKTTDCVEWDFLLRDENGEAQEYTVCPVCGETSVGTRLELLEDVTTKPITGWTPEGDLVFRQGELENGEEIISVSFEFDARLAQCTGVTDFIVPAEALEGYKVMLLDDEGGETELEVAVDGDTATITLDFSTLRDGSRIPVRMLHLVSTEA